MEPADSKPRAAGEPMTLKERVDDLIERMTAAVALHDRTDPKKRLVGEFRWVRTALDPLKDDLEDAGGHDRDLDLARMGDNDRRDVVRAIAALRRIDWGRVKADS